jgi:YD repeat-containing protein
MRIKILNVCLLLAVVFFSCKKVDLSDALAPGNTYTPVLSKVLIDNKAAYEYIYNDSGLISEEKSKFDYTAHQYNASGLLTSSKFYGNDDILSSDAAVSDKAMASTTLLTMASGKEGGTVTYEYNGQGQLLKSVTTRPSSSSTEYSVFEYNAENRISKQTMYWENAATGFIDYAYDKKGNLSSESLFNMPASGTAELITIITYTYDNGPNPYKATNKLQVPGINTNVNNILKETNTMHVSADKGSDKVMVTENSYKYNSLGYPISMNNNITFVY